MRKLNAVNLAASTAALVLLLVLDALAWWALGGQSFWIPVLVTWLITSLVALAAWRERRHVGPQTWGDWIWMFAGGLVLSTVFVAMNRGRDPGFSGLFEVGAIAMTLIALPSALRAWLIARREGQQADG